MCDIKVDVDENEYLFFSCAVSLFLVIISFHYFDPSSFLSFSFSPFAFALYYLTVRLLVIAEPNYYVDCRMFLIKCVRVVVWTDTIHRKVVRICRVQKQIPCVGLLALCIEAKWH